MHMLVQVQLVYYEVSILINKQKSSHQKKQHQWEIDKNMFGFVLTPGLSSGPAAMNPKLLLPILVLLQQVPLEAPCDQNDFETWWHGHCDMLPIVRSTLPACMGNHWSITWWHEVEISAGEGQMTRALWQCGYRGKAFDVAGLIRRA